jgi:hypothetical protein
MASFGNLCTEKIEGFVFVSGMAPEFDIYRVIIEDASEEGFIFFHLGLLHKYFKNVVLIPFSYSIRIFWLNDFTKSTGNMEGIESVLDFGLYLGYFSRIFHSLGIFYY